MTLTKLGTELQGASFAVKGNLTAGRGIILLRWVIDLIGMTPYGDPIVREWPGADGVGGHGTTIIQSLVESFAVIETWPDLGGFYLVIHSCRRFDPFKVWSFLEALGYRVIDTSGSMVSIIRRKPWWKRILKRGGDGGEIEPVLNER